MSPHPVENRTERNDGREQVKYVRDDELTERLPVILLIRAKCFKAARTEKGQTAVRMKGSKLEWDRKGSGA